MTILDELRSINCNLSPIVAELHNSKIDLNKKDTMIIWLLTFLINEITNAKLQVDIKNGTVIVGRPVKGEEVWI